MARENYHALAGRYSAQGLQGAAVLSRQFKESDHQAAYVTVVSYCINYLARGSQTEEYLLFIPHPSSQWLPFLHGIRMIIDLVSIENTSADPTGKVPTKRVLAEQPAKVMLKRPELNWSSHLEHLDVLVKLYSHSTADIDSSSKLQ